MAAIAPPVYSMTTGTAFQPLVALLPSSTRSPMEEIKVTGRMLTERIRTDPKTALGGFLMLLNRHEMREIYLTCCSLYRRDPATLLRVRASQEASDCENKPLTTCPYGYMAPLAKFYLSIVARAEECVKVIESVARDAFPGGPDSYFTNSIALLRCSLHRGGTGACECGVCYFAFRCDTPSADGAAVGHPLLCLYCADEVAVICDRVHQFGIDTEEERDYFLDRAGAIPRLRDGETCCSISDAVVGRAKAIVERYYTLRDDVALLCDGAEQPPQQMLTMSAEAARFIRDADAMYREHFQKWVHAFDGVQCADCLDKYEIFQEWFDEQYPCTPRAPTDPRYCRCAVCLFTRPIDDVTRAIKEHYRVANTPLYDDKKLQLAEQPPAYDDLARIYGYAPGSDEYVSVNQHFGSFETHAHRMALSEVVLVRPRLDHMPTIVYEEPEAKRARIGEPIFDRDIPVIEVADVPVVPPPPRVAVAVAGSPDDADAAADAVAALATDEVMSERD